MVPTGKYLIVNADDFGQSAGVNRGITAAHEEGVVTSASLMVRWPGAGEAAAYARTRPQLSLGLHVDLGEWTYRDGDWTPLYEVVALKAAGAVAEEVARQVATFQRLVGANPTHIDSHQHVHLREPVHSIVVEAGRALGVPVRQVTPWVHYCGAFYGQTEEGAPLPDRITVQGLLETLSTLADGCTELGCHPGLGDDLETMYRNERAQELAVLRDPVIRKAIVHMGFELCSFRSGRAMAGDAA